MTAQKGGGGGVVNDSASVWVDMWSKGASYVGRIVYLAYTTETWLLLNMFRSANTDGFIIYYGSVNVRYIIIIIIQPIGIRMSL